MSKRKYDPIMRHLGPIMYMSDIRYVVGKLADQINDKYKRESLNIITIMDGGFMLAAHLSVLLNHCHMAFVTTSSYIGTTRGPLQVFGLDRLLLPHRPTIIIDDIADSGTTLAEVSRQFQQKYPDMVFETLALFVRVDCPVEVGYAGVEVPHGKWLAGFGMDWRNGDGRNDLDVRFYPVDGSL